MVHIKGWFLKELLTNNYQITITYKWMSKVKVTSLTHIRDYQHFFLTDKGINNLPLQQQMCTHLDTLMEALCFSNTGV